MKEVGLQPQRDAVESIDAVIADDRSLGVNLVTPSEGAHTVLHCQGERWKPS